MPPDQPTVRLTRNDVIALGRAGRPWEFLPVILEVLEAVQGDPGLRFLAAANFARIGLGAPAREFLDTLPPQAAADPDVASLRRAVESLPDDRVPAAERLEVCRANAAAVRGADLSDALAEWARALPRWECYRALDGNIVRRLRDGRGASAWVGLSDQRAVAARFSQTHLSKLDLFPRPFAIEGLDPPWVFVEVYRATRANGVGYRPRIALLQADPAELLDGLSVCDLREHLADPRVTIYTGSDGLERFERDAGENLDVQVVPAFVPLHVVRTRFSEAPAEAFARIARSQSAEFDRLRDEVEAEYSKRDAAWWSRRWAEARGGGPPLRVLVPTTRYSTFVRHASADLVEAFAAAGCRAELLVEPEPGAVLSTVGILRAVRDAQPDLIVVINYPRARWGDGVLPANVPLVCWVQDAMPHLFDGDLWRGQGAMDFVAGYVYTELVERFGVPAENTMPTPMVVSDRKFHDGPVDPDLAREHECELAYVGHQSETPEAQRDRFLREQAESPALQRCTEALWPRLREAVRTPESGRFSHAMAELVDRVVAETLGEPSPELAVHLRRVVAEPAADRILRHQTLAWAAAIAQRRGWRFRLYGRGWEKHPTLARFACGELAHGEELRASYRAAAAHLHVAASTNRHQRVLECFASGGLCLCRRLGSDLWPVLDRALDAMVRDNEPAVTHVETGRLGFWTADHPAMTACAALYQRYGLSFGAVRYLSPEEVMRRRARAQRSERNDAWLLGDPAEITFVSERDLESLLERAVERPAWRAVVTRGVARRIRERCTTDALAASMVAFVRRRLEELAPEARGRPAQRIAV